MGVINLPTGKPTFALTGGAAERLAKLTPPGMTCFIHLTITDEYPYAQAQVIIEALPAGGLRRDAPQLQQHRKASPQSRRAADAAPSLTNEQRDACETAIGYRFKDPTLLDRAMTHRCAAQGKAVAWSNERLEFLGDRMLGLVIVETLMERFPTLREGELAPRLNALVSRDACAVIGAELGLGQFLIVDESERATRRPREALAPRQRRRGGDRSDLSRRRAREVAREVHPEGTGPSCSRARMRKAARSQISAAGMGAGRGPATPTYRHDAREGPDHAPVFTATVHVDGHDPVIRHRPVQTT